MPSQENHFLENGEHADTSTEETTYAPQGADPTSSLPIEQYRGEIIERVSGNESMVLIGETGSGKTTKVGGYLLDAFPDSNICIT